MESKMRLTQDILRPIGMYVVYHESSPNPVFLNPEFITSYVK